MSEHLNISYLSILLWYITALSILKMCRNQLFCLLNASDFQSNFSGSNTFGIMKISSRQGYFEPVRIDYSARSGGLKCISF